MTTPKMMTLDGNEAVASVAHRLSETAVIYPITPSSPMGEFVEGWAAQQKTNLWGNVPDVIEMQSEGGAIGAVHGALQAGSLATTFTASQGLLLMIPNMYKIAGEMLPFVMHVAARTLATHALSIFGDHSDVMACRQTGFIMLSSNSVQEAHDLAAISHAATFNAKLPILHFMDGFRTSHEVQKIELLTDEQLSAIIDEDAIAKFRASSLTPDHPAIRGTAQNPDVFFQAREAINPYYDQAPGIVQDMMDKFAEVTGRQYKLYEYEGAEDADRVVIIMGSGAETVAQTVEHLNDNGEKVGVLKIRLYRPFPISDFVSALPKTVKALSVLDRTKEPGATGEPLYQDVITALREAKDTGLTELDPVIVGGRYGLSSKEFTPAMVKGVFEDLTENLPKNHFTVGILDDISKTSLKWDNEMSIEKDNVFRAVFYGLGADGTVGANKNTIKIIGEETDNYAQGYFVYDSKKSGAMTISHLRFGPDLIRAPYLINDADFVACHQFMFTESFDVLQLAKPNSIFLLNSPFPADEVWSRLPEEIQQTIIDKKIKVFTIDAEKVAQATGMGRRINTIMQTCFFAISGILPKDEAIAKIKHAIEKTYASKGQNIVEQNFKAVDSSVDNLHEVVIPEAPTADFKRPEVVPSEAPDFVQKVTAEIMAGRGDLLPVSAFPVNGTWPMDTCQWEKRGIATEIPVWDDDICIQCNKCALVCPHAAIRAKAVDESTLTDSPDTFKSMDYKAKDLKGLKYTLQVAPDDCTGCNLCVMVCPSKSKTEPGKKALNMDVRLPLLEEERKNWDFFMNLPETPREKIVRLDAKGSQFLEPMFEFSGACSGCGETPYVKLLTQLFGDRMMIANATGCSSIYGGNLPTTPYTCNAEGRGPAWSNSLFEDNAEYGFGMRLSMDSQRDAAVFLVKQLENEIGTTLVTEILDNVKCKDEVEIAAQRGRIETLKMQLADSNKPEAKRLLTLADALAHKSVWIVGGDGWAYDIGYGGLDHVLANTRDINIIVLDTEVYSNTGGQASKATPLGAAAKFATSGKLVSKKDLGLMAMSYGHVYVASVALGAKDNQVVQAMKEAEAYDGPSIIIAYSHCIAHGYDLKNGLDHQKLAVDAGIWPLYRYDPDLALQGKPRLQLDSKVFKGSVSEYMAGENRFRQVKKAYPEIYDDFVIEAERQARERIEVYKQLSQIVATQGDPEEKAPAKPADTAK
ncbi:pyruvate:ferredoxin (flavodoxin) oxidoreductase [Poriferisphaera sp. WC338]|uniref:pyruvate:ferredoxin (flavodoxin) oxidoreductase n=1 Tax=Poriferisphaera sp. WC338 TaxID=3425129 RepID=UPI003D815D39